MARPYILWCGSYVPHDPHIHEAGNYMHHCQGVTVMVSPDTQPSEPESTL